MERPCSSSNSVVGTLPAPISEWDCYNHYCPFHAVPPMLEAENAAQLSLQARINQVRKELLRQQSKPSRGKCCKFCRKNKEDGLVVAHHNLQDGATGAVTCPLLQLYACELCGATGPRAHTIKFCPLNRPGGASLRQVMEARKRIDARNWLERSVSDVVNNNVVVTRPCPMRDLFPNWF